MPNPQIQRLQATAIDGRAHNIFFRQTQLERLCRGLLAEESALRQAMISDCNYTTSEAIAVLHASIQTVKDVYATLQPVKALEEEYRVYHGKDAVGTGTPFGLVYIEPEAHTLLYSICSPVSAAIAAGNCVAILLENSLRELPGLMRRILADALDADTFTIVSSPVKDQDFLDNPISVRQVVDCSQPRINELLTPSSSTAVAVIDRTGDIGLAAREVVRARSAFDGKSPYAPDAVLVNEFVIKDFLRAIMTECGGTVSDDVDKQLNQEKAVEGLIKIDLRKGTSTLSDAGLGLSQVLQTKLLEAVLLIQPFRSLDDAINLLSGRQSGAYISAYHFSDLRSAKYLSQFVEAEVTFVNHIPRGLLIGPTAPRGRVFDLQNRFPVLLFSRQRPTFVQPQPESQKLTIALETKDNASAQALLQEAKQPLKVMKRSEGGGVGFFEQGLLMNASFILASILTVSATGVWQLWKYRSSR